MERIDPPLGLGARLRAARLERGLSQRRLTRMIGLSAHSNLADYEAGRRVPPVDILEACERALGLPHGELLALRRASVLERDPGREQPPRTVAARAAPRGRPPRWLAFTAAAALLLAGGIVIGHLLSPPIANAAIPYPAALSRCDPSAQVLDSAMLVVPSPVRSGGRKILPAGTDLGVVALRYSPACRLAWGRFLVAPGLVSTHASLVLSMHRLQDGAETTIRLSRAVSAESDPLLTATGCVYAEAIVTFAQAPSGTAPARTAPARTAQSVTAQTGCFQRG